MLVKEYRISLPMSVEEYRIAQLYMIQVRYIQVSSRTIVGFVLTIFNEGAYLTFKSIFHKALKLF